MSFKEEVLPFFRFYRRSKLGMTLKRARGSWGSIDTSFLGVEFGRLGSFGSSGAGLAGLAFGSGAVVAGSVGESASFVELETEVRGGRGGGVPKNEGRESLPSGRAGERVGDASVSVSVARSRQQRRMVGTGPIAMVSFS